MSELKSIRSAALLICTYKRPRSFKRLVQSIAALAIPEGLAFAVVVADNNPTSEWESYIEEAVAGLPWSTHYGHEAEAGYSSARNKAIEVAVAKTDADILLFVDDDMILDPGWLAGHLVSHEEMGCDVVNGRIFGVRERFEHGASLEKCGAGNVSFNRRLVDAAAVGLRFDPAFNKLGMEDQDFFRRAKARGAVIRQSDHPLIFNYYGEEDMPQDEVINKMLTTACMHHNLVAKARTEAGVTQAVGLAIRGIPFGLKAIGHTVASGFFMLAQNPEKFRRTQLSARKEYLKMRGRITGLSGEIVSRQDIRRQDPV